MRKTPLLAFYLLFYSLCPGFGENFEATKVTPNRTTEILYIFMFKTIYNTTYVE